MSDFSVHAWFEEIFEQQVGQKFLIKDYLYSAKSDFQKIDIFDTYSHGKLLAHDGMVMITERDEFIYHDMIVHPALFTHPCPKNVLVIGGGDGGTVREVLRHPQVEQCTMVEIDGMVVEACKKYFPQTSSRLDDPKVTLLFEDGVSYVKNTSEKFDVIIVDSSDPIGPAAPLFNSEFYCDVEKCLAEDGIVVSQAESPYYHMPMQKKLLEIITPVFPKVHLLNYSNLSYPGGFWTFSFASKTYCPYRDFSRQRVEDSKLAFQYYNPQVHFGAFALPQFMQEAHRQLLTPLPELCIAA